MYTTYIIYSERLNQRYTGSTRDLVARLDRHNRGASSYTAKGCPWRLVYRRDFPSRGEAMRHEQRIKKTGAHKFLASRNAADASP